MEVPDASLRVAFQFMKRNTNTFTMCASHAFIATHKRSKRNGLRRRERRIPSCTMFCARDLLAIFVLVGLCWLMPDKLHGVLWMLPFAQPCELLISYRAM
jgi:hypothetical protein